MGEDEIEAVLRFFKALADASRLRLVGLLAERERGVDELAAALALTPPTVSHHLSRLRAAGLVAMRREGTSHVYRLDTEALRRLSREVLTPERVRSFAAGGAGVPRRDDTPDAPDPAADPAADTVAPLDARERKVLRGFFAGERLKEIPAGRKKRRIVLRWLAERFEPGVRYSEREVNEILARSHPDTATLRRELISDANGLMRRDHGVYWRLTDAAGA
jgi:DNA-binding transcriptional ArsR family regulator